MVQRDSIKQGSKSRAGAKSVARVNTRASSRQSCLNINLASDALKALMIEQSCGAGSGRYLTVYRGSRVELGSAGIPDAAFPSSKAAKAFKVQTENVCCTGSKEILSGTMRNDGSEFELEIQWGYIRPYLQGGHPALTELARMMLKDLTVWTSIGTLEGPFEVLAADSRATDYKPASNSKKLQVTPEFRKRLDALAMEIYERVHSYGEIVVTEPLHQGKAHHHESPGTNVIAFSC